MSEKDQSSNNDADSIVKALSDKLSRVERDTASLKNDMDRIIQSLVVSLKRDRSFDELQQQLRDAEKISQAWRDAPLIIGIHDAVTMLKQTDDADKHLLAHLENLLYVAGVDEYGVAGDVVEPEEAEVTESIGAGPVLRVSVCKRPGLRIGGVPLRKPIVEVTREERMNQ